MANTRHLNLMLTAWLCFCVRMQGLARQTFKDLANSANLPDSVRRLHLRKLIPKEHHYLVKGAANMTQAWAMLDEVFGDNLSAIQSVRYKLMELDLGRGTAMEKVEKLASEIMYASLLLRNLGAKDFLIQDTQLVSHLCVKLPETINYQ